MKVKKEEILPSQIKTYRKLSGPARLNIALELGNLTYSLSQKGKQYVGARPTRTLTAGRQKLEKVRARNIR